MTTLSWDRNRSDGPDRWTARAPANRRKASTNTGSILSNNWARNSKGDALRQAASNTYQIDTSRGRDRRVREIQASDETGADDNGANVEKPKIDEYSPKTVPKNAAANRDNETVPRRKPQYADEGPEYSECDPMMAMQKLHTLKELQRRRDLTERYYSQEIRRLIGEHYFGPQMTLPQVRLNERLQNSNLQPYTGDRFRNMLRSLEPCGTMTTITRLDCGCVQETTKPIFTTPKGRVLKKVCNKEEVLLKLASANPQEHLCQSRYPRRSKCGTLKPKKRLSLEDGDYTENPPELETEAEVVNVERRGVHRHRMNQERQSLKPSRITRRHSDSSVTSIDPQN